MLKINVIAVEQSFTAVQQSVKEIVDTVRLHAWQCYELKAAVSQKAQEFVEKYGCKQSLMFTGIWGFLKRHFRVPTYNTIPAMRFDEALTVVKELTLPQMPDYVRETATKGVTA